MKQRNRFGLDVVVPFIILALVFGGMLFQKYQEARNLPETPPEVHTTAPQKAVLYFGNESRLLVPEGREIENCAERNICLRAILEELLSGPIGDLENVFPEWTTINSVSIDGDLATIDLAADFVDGLKPGSAAEMLAVFGIVNTVTANMTEIKRIKIVIDGDSRGKLRQLDISLPLLPDLTLLAQPPAMENQGK